MRAAILHEPLKLEITEVETPKPRENEILVRVRAIGVCPSDVRYYLGIGVHRLIKYGKDSYGLIGHEWSGEVCEIGPKVEGIDVGDRIAQDHLVPCGICRYCGMGLTNLCLNKVHYLRGFAEYALAYAPNVYKLSEGVSFEEAAFAEPLSCVVHAQRIACIRPRDVVVIIGAGPMGLLHMQLAKLAGALVVITDMVKERVKKEKDLGADYAVDITEEDPIILVKYITNGIGADKVIVSVGGKRPIEQSFQIARKNGIIVLFGGTVPPENIEVNPNIIHYGEIIVTGSTDYTREDFRRTIELINNRRLRLKELITHTFPLEKLKEAFETVVAKKGLKVMVHP